MTNVRWMPRKKLTSIHWKTTKSVYFMCSSFLKGPGGRMVKKKKRKSQTSKETLFLCLLTHIQPSDTFQSWCPSDICSLQVEGIDFYLFSGGRSQNTETWYNNVHTHIRRMCDWMHVFVSVHSCTTVCTVLIQQQEESQGKKILVYI